MRNLFLILSLLLLSAGGTLYAQKAAVKTNLIADGTSTINLAVEVGLGQKTTLDLYGNYNPWKFSERKYFKHTVFQPEFRYWFCERFNGHFIGTHLHAGVFNVSGVKMPFGMWTKLKTHRYQGELVGAGISYGYQWVLGRHWNLEGNIGAGYAYINYDKYNCGNCGVRLAKDEKHHYFGPTKAAVTLMYVF